MFFFKKSNILDLVQNKITDIVKTIVESSSKKIINVGSIPNVIIERNKNVNYGDFSTNIAMLLGFPQEQTINIAKEIVGNLNKKYFEKISVSHPGFINFSIANKFSTSILFEIIKKRSKFNKKKKTKLNYNIEFVSANPTGLLHVGHARNAVIGDILATIMQDRGINVTREYYINDAGNQIDKLAISVLIRYLQLFGKKVELFEDSYHGNEIKLVASHLKEKYGNEFIDIEFDNTNFSPSFQTNANKIKKFSIDFLLDKIKNSLDQLGVRFDVFFSESNLYKSNIIDEIINNFGNYIYEKDGALWLRTTLLNDDKDRVLRKSDGTNTYFLPDIAYHIIKLSRGYDKIYDIWGADHASYAERMKIALQLFGYHHKKLEILLMQMVRLTKNGQEFKMSKRSGNSLTLNDVIQIIGKDQTRWLLSSQPLSKHLEINIDNINLRNENNQLFYVQYAHARIFKIIKMISFDVPKNFNLLTHKFEKQIISLLNIYESTLDKIVLSSNINILNIYLLNLSRLFHSYYSQVRIIDKTNLELSKQRYWLIFCVKQVIANGLRLMSIEAADSI